MRKKQHKSAISRRSLREYFRKRKYIPHQGKQEKARRARQIKMGIIHV